MHDNEIQLHSLINHMIMKSPYRLINRNNCMLTFLLQNIELLLCNSSLQFTIIGDRCHIQSPRRSKFFSIFQRHVTTYKWKKHDPKIQHAYRNCYIEWSRDAFIIKVNFDMKFIQLQFLFTTTSVAWLLMSSPYVNIHFVRTCVKYIRNG